jgi:hypothetical protein
MQWATFFIFFSVVLVSVVALPDWTDPSYELPVDFGSKVGVRKSIANLKNR